MTAQQRASSRWRVLLHDMRGTTGAGVAPHVQSDQMPVPPHSPHVRTMVLSNTDLDEVTVGRWMHLEQLDVGQFWLSVAGVVLHVAVDPDGRATSVRVVSASDDEQGVVDGCTYAYGWDER